MTDTHLLKAERQIPDILAQISLSPPQALSPDAKRKLRQAAAFLGVALDLLEEVHPMEPIEVS